MTVRETLDFSAHCQGIGSRAEVLDEVSRREKEAGIVPDPNIDTYMKAISVEGQKTNLQTDYILKVIIQLMMRLISDRASSLDHAVTANVFQILGLDVCADTLFGDATRRGISGGQKKRLTTGEMIVGPTNALFMDEISNGLDSSTTYQIITCLQQLAHIIDATVLVSLLQPSPEAFDLFDDIMLMAEGKIVYHGPGGQFLKFFEECGCRCPERKGVADFLQEVLSKKDQAQYSYPSEKPHCYVSIDTLSRKFNESCFGKKLDEDLTKPFMKLLSHKNDISFHMYSLSKWELFRACMSREFLLMRRNSFIYVFKLVQVAIEVPYLLVNTLAFVIITYPKVGYHWTAYKVFWYFYSMVCTLMYFTYLGMLLVSLTPSLPVASIVSSVFYTMFNLFAGFLIPRS